MEEIKPNKKDSNYLLYMIKKDWLVLLICLVVLLSSIYVKITVEETVNKELERCNQRWSSQTKTNNYIPIEGLDNIIIGGQNENKNPNQNT